VAHYLVLTRRGVIEVKPVDVKEADNKKPSLKQESAEFKTSTLAPEVENTKVEPLPTSFMIPKQESDKQVKVPEIQSTLLSAGWRSRRAVSTRSKGDKRKDSNSSDAQTNVVDHDTASEMNAEEPQAQKRRGRPSKNRPSGKAAFSGSGPKARLEAKPEPVDGILILDSDTEDSSCRPNSNTETIAQRLRRRVTC